MAETSSKGKGPATYKRDGPRRIVQEKVKTSKLVLRRYVWDRAADLRIAPVDFDVKIRYATVGL